MASPPARVVIVGGGPGGYESGLVAAQLGAEVTVVDTDGLGGSGFIGAFVGGMVGGVQRLQTVGNAETRVVPARGAVLGMQDLRTQYDMYGTIYDRLTQLLNKGRSPGEAVAAKPTKEYDALMGNGDEFVRRSFESLWAYLSPDA